MREEQSRADHLKSLLGFAQVVRNSLECLRQGHMAQKSPFDVHPRHSRFGKEEEHREGNRYSNNAGMRKEEVSDWNPCIFRFEGF